MKKKVHITLLIILGLIVTIFAVSQIVKVSIRKGLKEDFEKFIENIMHWGQTEELEDGVISYNGTKYRYNEDLVTILCMGVDTSVTRVNMNVPGDNGQADAIFLILFDEKDKTVKFINVPMCVRWRLSGAI